MPAMGYLDTQEVCERYRISERTLHRWMRNKSLEFPQPFRFGRRFYFRLIDLDCWAAKQGAEPTPAADTALGMPIVSEVIQDYTTFVQAMRRRRQELGISGMELDARSGMQEGYTSKLENFGRPQGRGMGPVVFPLWIGGLDLGIILVDLPRRPNKADGLTQRPSA
ncbi:helix-turn-helix domain-containing protein [Rhizobium ruizarguesonis]